MDMFMCKTFGRQRPGNIKRAKNEDKEKRGISRSHWYFKITGDFWNFKITGDVWKMLEFLKITGDVATRGELSPWLSCTWRGVVYTEMEKKVVMAFGGGCAPIRPVYGEGRRCSTTTSTFSTNNNNTAGQRARRARRLGATTPVPVALRQVSNIKYHFKTTCSMQLQHEHDDE